MYRFQFQAFHRATITRDYDIVLTGRAAPSAFWPRRTPPGKGTRHGNTSFSSYCATSPRSGGSSSARSTSWSSSARATWTRWRTSANRPERRAECEIPSPPSAVRQSHAEKARRGRDERNGFRHFLNIIRSDTERLHRSWTRWKSNPTRPRSRRERRTT